MQHPPKVPIKKKTNPKASRRRKALFLCVTLVLTLAFVLFLPSMPNLFPTEAQMVPPSSYSFQTLDTGEREQLSSITVTHEGGEAYTLLYQNERLFLKREGGTPTLINEAYMEQILRAATTIAVEDTIAADVEEVRAHLGDMGLDSPSITVRVRYQNDREDLLQFGNRVPDTTYFYYRWSGDNGVYMCDEGLYEAFEYTAAMLLPVEQPLLQQSLIDHMSLRIRGQEDLELQFAITSGGAITGTMQQPYPYPLDSGAAQSLITAAANFRLGTKQGPVTSENSADYGFVSPMAVIDIHQQQGAYGEIDEEGALVTLVAEEQTLRIVIGREEGDYFYTCEYAGECYYVSRFLVATLVGATPEKLITKNPADLGDAVIAAIQVQNGGTLLDIRHQRTERVLPNNQLDMDQEGNILYDVTVTLGGEPMSEDAFKALVQRLKAMQVVGNVDEGFSIGSGAPRWQLTLTTQAGVIRTLAAYAVDPFFDAIAVDGQVRHVMQAESLEVALAGVDAQ